MVNTLASPSKEVQLINWPVTEDIVRDHSRSFITHWTKDSPIDVSLTCQVIGTDPTFGFARICDETPPKKVFKQTTTAVGQQGKIRVTRHDETTGNVQDGAKMLVEVRGKCFNASLTVEKYENRCPWCPDPSVKIHVEGHTDPLAAASSHNIFDNFNIQEPFIQTCVLLVLAATTVITSTACGCLLVMLIKQRRHQKSVKKFKNSTSKASLQYANLRQNGNSLPGGQYHQVVEPLKGKVVLDRLHREETRYQTPWDSKYRPLPCYLSSSSTSSEPKSNSTTTSPMDSTSVLARVYGQTTSGPYHDHGSHLEEENFYVLAETLNRHSYKE